MSRTLVILALLFIFGAVLAAAEEFFPVRFGIGFRCCDPDHCCRKLTSCCGVGAFLMCCRDI
uniref:Cysteine rich secreted protein n=1 Tax=Riptortus pedestris TaxID=329032 RepID=R4WD08_RIPPE|nr:cysteine rich secreted protein [Riptortus pedestris]